MVLPQVQVDGADLMGDNLYDMMLRRAGIQYNSDIVKLIGIETWPEIAIWVSGEEKPIPGESLVHTVRFVVVGHYPDEDTPIRPTRRRRRST